MCGPECEPDPECKYWNPVVSDAVAIQAFNNLHTLHDALDLVAELWPKPGNQTVVMTRDQWDKLRHVLLSIPDLVAINE